MDTLITIKPFDVENREIRKNTTRIPGTIRRSQINNDVADKFRNFDKVKKGIISLDMIYSIKPELMITFPKYEENISLATAIKRLAVSNVLISEKFGRKDLSVTPEQLEKALNKLIKQKETISQEKIDNSLSSSDIISLREELNEKNEIIDKQQKEINELKRREIVYTTVMNEYEANDQLKDDIKLVA